LKPRSLGNAVKCLIVDRIVAKIIVVDFEKFAGLIAIVASFGASSMAIT
jgi:hypothetical protein